MGFMAETGTSNRAWPKYGRAIVVMPPLVMASVTITLAILNRSLDRPPFLTAAVDVAIVLNAFLAAMGSMIGGLIIRRSPSLRLIAAVVAAAWSLLAYFLVAALLAVGVGVGEIFTGARR